MTGDARRIAEYAARTSYGRLVAMLARQTGDLAGAEDALADAFAAALRRWPESGVPGNPDGWLLTAARRAMGHARSRDRTARHGEVHMILLQEEREGAAPIPFGDDRLKLMFVCTHPGLAPDVQTPLMLQTVLGLDAARIAACFLVSPAAMGQKLVRAKAKIRAAGIAFVIPEAEALAGRTAAVRDAIYAAYGTGWDDLAGADPKAKGLAEEAIWLGRMVADLLPDDPEAMGLLALMLHCEARRPARRGPDGGYVALHRQDAALWSRPMIAEAEALLRAAAPYGQPGRYQTEAAIQSLHFEARVTGRDLRASLAALYDRLVAVAPSTGAAVARAIAHAEAGAVGAARAQLAAIDAPGYQPWWAAQARILWLAGECAEAEVAARRAAGLSSDPAVRDFLLNGGIFDERH